MIYKVLRNIKHKKHGWLKFGRFVECRPEFAKRFLVRRELMRCHSADSVKALWIDDIDKPGEKAVEKAKPVEQVFKRKKRNGKVQKQTYS